MPANGRAPAVKDATGRILAPASDAAYYNITTSLLDPTENKSDISSNHTYVDLQYRAIPMDEHKLVLGWNWIRIASPIIDFRTGNIQILGTDPTYLSLDWSSLPRHTTLIPYVPDMTGEDDTNDFLW
ncbi:MAG: hypothetical protein M1823_004512, partial [Watsoniomyces obsoletus]